MILRRAIDDVINCTALFFLLAVGLVPIFLYFSLPLRYALLVLLENNETVFLFMGISLVSTVILLSFVKFQLAKGKFFRIKMGTHPIDVKKSAVEKDLKLCLKKQFAGVVTLEDVDLSDRTSLEVCVKMLSKEKKMDEKLFQHVEKELKHLLEKRFGYKGGFFLVAKL